ncbi:MAG TPA: alpha-amylase/4-alpha-glucanotransferase domain-containing protein [Chloroflexia bacterium]|nr:alpha-amylase/4-alpha-glucanotransferase domain-containing protein [Chloroflexia bacterium]
METTEQDQQVRCYEQEHNGSPRLVLANGESHLVVDPAQGGRWITWDLTLGAAPPRRLMSAPDAGVTAGPVVLAAAGATPEMLAGLGPASPSGLGDHFFALTVSQRDFALGAAKELGTFTAGAFTATHYRPARGQHEVAMQFTGGIRGAKRVTPVSLLKRLTLGGPGGEISIHYRIDNPDAKALQVYFGVEFCFALSPDALAPHADRPAYEFDGARERGGYQASGIAKQTTSVALYDPQPGVTIRLGWERAAAVWVCPAPAGATGAAIRGASILPVWDLRIPPEDNWAVNIWLQAGASGPVRPIDPRVVARIARPESEDEPWK